MSKSYERKIVLVVRPTRLDELIARFNTEQQAQFYVEHMGADFSDYLMEHKKYKEAVVNVESVLRSYGIVQNLERRFLPNYTFGLQDIVVVLGQDGLVANTIKYLNQQRVIALNPDPKRWNGVLMPFEVKDLHNIIKEEVTAPRLVKKITMAKASLNDGQELYAVNDFYIGQKTHVSSRYVLRLGQNEESQSSSGIIVSTGLGSTGWLKSIYAGWKAASKWLVQKDFEQIGDGSFAWDSDILNYYVREPYPSVNTKAEMVMGRINNKEKITIVSQMSENGVIFSDGIENDFLEFNSGSKVDIGIAERQGLLVV
ncbi:MAG: sugar kinase [Alphaproteobacteria bacterium]